MKSIALQEIVQVVSGQASVHLPQARVSAICTDTRHLREGALFIAIRGETHDGHEFLAAAAKAGAAAALVEREVAGAPGNLPLIRVGRTRAAMGQLARHLRGKLSGTVIAVGGSNGKTGTKNLIHSVLSTCLRGTISPKSFNNDIGVPLAIFPADEAQDYLVLELGTNHPGELRVLSEMASPDVAVITNCMEEHLEGFGDLAGVRAEEASIIVGLDPDGLLVVNGDDALLLRAVASHPGKRITFGRKHSNDLYATQIECGLSGVRYRLNGEREVFVPLLGAHVAVNSLAAVAVARRMGMSDDEIVAGLAKASGPEMRLQLEKHGGVTVLNDAYNANPGSMKAAIETLCSLPTSGRRIAVVGDMRELGEATDKLHRELGAFMAGCALDAIVCVGEKAALVAESAIAGGFPAERVSRYADAKAAGASVAGMLVEGDLVLLKGSRYMRMETIMEK